MKYRIVATNNDLFPFKVQRKNEKSFFVFWRKVTECKSYNEAYRFVRDATERHSKYPAGATVLEYDESDLVVEKLKNQQNQQNSDKAEGAQINVASATMGMIPGVVSKDYIMKMAGLK